MLKIGFLPNRPFLFIHKRQKYRGLLRIPPPFSDNLRKLLSQTQFLDDCTVTIDIFFLQVVEHIAATTYHFQQTTSGVMVVFVSFEMLGQVVDSLGKNCDLYFSGTCVGVVQSVLFDYLCFFFFSNIPQVIIIRATD